jgi:CheY-like chemotaxis protein
VPGTPSPSATVLVADDDPEARSIIAHVLADEGYRVIEAADGTQALEILSRAADQKEALPDVVLLDFVMPGFSGLGILRIMRRFERVPATIVMTAFPDPSVESFATALGALRVLRKPIELDELCEVVLEAASPRGGGRARSA